MIIDDATITEKVSEIDKALRELEINANRELAFLNGKRAALMGLLQQGKNNEQAERTETPTGTA
jgi:hypothetical protein